jgi:predicted phage terminase large subunit-like protein
MVNDALIYKLENELRRRKFKVFVEYFAPEFYLPRKQYLEEICDALQEIADGKIKTLSVSLPPRFGKSYITTLFCAWMLGKHPTESLMRNTCTATLARKLSYDTREILKHEKFTAVFPDVRLSDDKAAVDGWNTNHAKQVSYFCAGVGGTIIGFGASKLAITDDLFKSMEDAMSETIREKTHSWKEATHDSRKETGCAEIDIGTRWTRDDVIGKNMQNGYYDKSIIVPAIDEFGNSTCEAVMTTEEYRIKREKTREEIWLAEYMQQPVDIKGRLFENLKTFTDIEHVRANSEGALAYIDVADEGKDYLCMLVGHLVAQNVYITDVVYTKANTDVTIPTCAELLNKNKARFCRVETNGMGGVFLKGLRKLTTTKVIGIANSTNKQTRIIMNSQMVLNNFYFIDADKGEYYQFLQGLKAYSKEGKNLNDDAPDATTGLAMFYQVQFPKLW